VDGWALDLNRHAVKNTAHAKWYSGFKRERAAPECM
jgi:hypothetical protein